MDSDDFYVQRIKNNPIISVVIPLYNKGRYIKRALDSVFAQTFQDFDVFVIDDGSTDDGPEIVRRYPDFRLRIIHQENAGPGAARNRGIRESHASYVAFLDADDEWLPEFLENRLEKMKKYPKCDVVIGPSHCGSQKTDQSSIWREIGIQEGEWKLFEDSTWKDLKLVHGLFHPCSAVFRRKVLEKYSGFYDKNKCCFSEDRYLWLQIVLNHQIYISMQPLFWYHSENSELYPPDVYGKPGYISPVLSDTDQIYSNCPAEYLHILQRYLCYAALQSVGANYLSPDFKQLKSLLIKFPGKRYFLWKYIKMILKVYIIRRVDIWRNR
jgi:glycosyltransferase involved in cell wall biosynthesis